MNFQTLRLRYEITISHKTVESHCVHSCAAKVNHTRNFVGALDNMILVFDVLSFFHIAAEVW